jgi:hypothetical protein
MEPESDVAKQTATPVLLTLAKSAANTAPYGVSHAAPGCLPAHLVLQSCFTHAQHARLPAHHLHDTQSNSGSIRSILIVSVSKALSAKKDIATSTLCSHASRQPRYFIQQQAPGYACVTMQHCVIPAAALQTAQVFCQQEHPRHPHKHAHHAQKRLPYLLA